MFKKHSCVYNVKLVPSSRTETIMKNLALVILSFFIFNVTSAQIKPAVNDSTSVKDTMEEKIHEKEVADTSAADRQSTGKIKRFRRLSPTADLRSIDGLFLGLALKLNKKSSNDSNLHKISALKSLRTQALIFEYKAEWKNVFHRTDFLINGLADIKGNILNFFGRGNETLFDRTGDFRLYYRDNFSYFQLEPLVRFNLRNRFSLSFGPSIQHFVFNANDNADRFINTPRIVSQYDYLSQEKTHGGAVFSVSHDTRDNSRTPSKGHHFNVKATGYEGLNKYSKAYSQIFPQVSFYKTLDKSGNIVLANRTGAGFTWGETAFYQSAFLGSQDNLLGFRKFRFAGDDLAYNNLELRVTLPRFTPSILRGKAGVIGFYDVGRVWVKGEESKELHHGYGGGVFLVPLNRVLLRAVAGFSNEGLQATVALRQRF
jgi:hypothetical protein